MIKSTMAVMFSFMLIACGNGEAAKVPSPDQQQSSQTESVKPDSNAIDTDAVDTDRIIPRKPDVAQQAPKPAAASTDGLTLTYFNLAG